MVRTIHTVEELKALPNGTRVMDVMGDVSTIRPVLLSSNKWLDYPDLPHVSLEYAVAKYAPFTVLARDSVFEERRKRPRPPMLQMYLAMRQYQNLHGTVCVYFSTYYGLWVTDVTYDKFDSSYFDRYEIFSNSHTEAINKIPEVLRYREEVMGR